MPEVFRRLYPVIIIFKMINMKKLDVLQMIIISAKVKFRLQKNRRFYVNGFHWILMSRFSKAVSLLPKRSVA